MKDYSFDSIIAYSDSYKKIITKAKKYAPTEATVLLTGSTGTGKSFLAERIHYNSNRKNKPFVKLNCANLSEDLLESTLFGHEKGSFTGADKRKIGLFQIADHGTVFLDEIGEISNNLQTKLLRVIEERQFERIGGRETINVDIRIIAATNVNLLKSVSEKTFREDLYYRLSVLVLHVPNLAERQECLPALAKSLLADLNIKYNKQLSFSDAIILAIKFYKWPGNIRQLISLIERAVILAETNIIDELDIPLEWEAVEFNELKKVTQDITLIEKNELALILRVLEECDWVQKKAAMRLNLTPRALNYKIAKYKIVHKHWRKNKEM